MNILIGADPEIWIVDNKTGKPISAEGLFEGTKANPYKVEHGAIQVDGMAAEFNINPASTSNEFVRNILSVLCALRDEIKRRNPDLDFSFSFTPVAYFGSEYIQAQPEHAKELGCTPDFNAYENGEANPTPDADMPYRTASGHVHVGWGEDFDVLNPEHIEACCMFSKQMDCFVAGPLLRFEGDDGKVRRQLYGKAGAFRPKPYGVEYRASSNVWLSDTSLMYKMYSATKESFQTLIDGYRAYEDDYYEDTRDFVNAGVPEIFTHWYKSHRGNGEVTIDTLDSLLKKAQIFVNDDINLGEDVGIFEDDEDDIIEDEWDADEFEPEIDEPQPVIQPPRGLAEFAAELMAANVAMGRN